MKRRFILLPLLLIVTLLALEMPKMYYQYSDRQLLKENGHSTYESKNFPNTEVWKQQAEVFFSDKTTRVERFVEIADEELYNEVLELVQELSTLLGGECKNILEEMLLNYKETRGYKVMFGYSDTVWKVGVWEFSLPSIGVSGVILYDANSNKIFFTELCTYISENEELPKVLVEQAPQTYYKEVDFETITVINEPGHILISPFSPETVYEKVLDEIYLTL